MKKCFRCGKPLLFFGRVSLSDADICTLCFKSLGFKISDVYSASSFKYDDIKDGAEQYYLNKYKNDIKQNAIDSISVTCNLFDRDLVCTEEEREIYELISQLFDDNGLEVDELELVRKSDSYVTILYKNSDLIRYKYTSRARWLTFPKIESRNKHHEIEDPEDIYQLTDEIGQSIKVIEEYI